MRSSNTVFFAGSFAGRLSAVFCATLLAIPGARGQGADGTNVVATGPLADLAHAAAKIGFKDEMPPRLSGLLWPGEAIKGKCLVRKILLDGKKENEKHVLIVRADNHDLIFARFVEIKPHADAKTRMEHYYRATPDGNLALALEVTFEYRISDTDSDILKNLSLQVYSDMAGAGTNALPVTPDTVEQFEKEKKLWLGQIKALKKQERQLDK